jgi:hypothetical protein
VEKRATSGDQTQVQRVANHYTHQATPSAITSLLVEYILQALQATFNGTIAIKLSNCGSYLQVN